MSSTAELRRSSRTRSGTELGRRPAELAVHGWGATKVDVDEQNAQTVRFYQKLGFHVRGRSEMDGLGKPYPLLHMRLA